MAKVLGYQDRRAVWPWFNTSREFPAEYCPTIERATMEKGTVVRCEELRPDVDWNVLRSQPSITPPEAPPLKPNAALVEALTGRVAT